MLINKILSPFALILLMSVLVVHSQEKASRLEIFDVNSTELNTKRTIRVYLPKGYHESKQKYPVLYMHDAQNLFDNKTAFAGEWNVDETLDSLNAKVIVVGIDNGGSKRLEELTPFQHEKHGGGKADIYLEFMVKTLKPLIDEKFRTKKSAKHTGIAGSSLGGLTSFYATLKYPKIFGKAAVFSPSFWYSEKIYDYAKAIKKIKSKYYFLAGDAESEDMVADMKRMIEIISEKTNQPVAAKVVTGGKHNEKLWRQSFASAYLYLFPNK